MRKKFLLILFASSIVMSCASAKVASVPENTAPQIIAERAYEEFGNKNYKTAIEYYQLIIDRFDAKGYQKEVAWAYYEIGFCYYYQGKFKEAIDYFNMVLNDFSVTPTRILASIVLEDIYTQKPKLKSYNNFN